MDSHRDNEISLRGAVTVIATDYLNYIKHGFRNGKLSFDNVGYQSLAASYQIQAGQLSG